MKDLVFWVTFGNDPGLPLKLRADCFDNFCHQLRDMSMKYGEFIFIMRDYR